MKASSQKSTTIRYRLHYIVSLKKTWRRLMKFRHPHRAILTGLPQGTTVGNTNNTPYKRDTRTTNILKPLKTFLNQEWIQR